MKPQSVQNEINLFSETGTSVLEKIIFGKESRYVSRYDCIIIYCNAIHIAMNDDDVPPKLNMYITLY